MEINPTGPEPPYRQIAAWLRDRIGSGELAPGDRLPTERDVMQETGCAATTVRRAVRLLASEGIVYTVAGRGTYVSS